VHAKDVYVCFVDLERACEWDPRETLWVIYQITG